MSTFAKYVERKGRDAPRMSRQETIRGISRVENQLAKLVASTSAAVSSSVSPAPRAISLAIGMQPGLFTGDPAEDPHRFLRECRRCITYNKVQDDEAVGQMSYFLEGDAREAYDAEVDDRLSLGNDPRITTQGSGFIEKFSPPTEDDDQEKNVLLLAIETAKSGYDAAANNLDNVMNKLKSLTSQIDAARQENIQGDSSAIGEDSLLSERSTRPGVGAAITRKGGSKSTLGKPSADSDSAPTSSGIISMDEIKPANSEEWLATLIDHRNTVMDERYSAEREVQKTQELLQWCKSQYNKWKTTQRGSSDDSTVTQRKEGQFLQDAQAFPTFDDFAKWLLSTFLLEEDTNTRVSEYLGRRHMKGESVADYAMDVLRLSRRSSLNVSMQDRTKQFFGGLHKLMKKTVQLQWDSGKLPTHPTKWQWSVLLAAVRKLERDIPELNDWHHEGDKGAHRVMMVQEPVHPPPPAPTASHPIPPPVQSICQLCEQEGHTARDCRANPPRRNPPNRRIDSRTVRCYNCSGLGHISRECTQRRQPRGSSNYQGQMNTSRRQVDLSTIRCYSCQEFGHYAPDCPTRVNRDRNRAPSQSVQVASGGRTDDRGRGRDPHCYNCGRDGHATKQCPTANESKVSINGTRE